MSYTRERKVTNIVRDTLVWLPEDDPYILPKAEAHDLAEAGLCDAKELARVRRELVAANLELQRLKSEGGKTVEVPHPAAQMALDAFGGLCSLREFQLRAENRERNAVEAETQRCLLALDTVELPLPDNERARVLDYIDAVKAIISRGAP